MKISRKISFFYGVGAVIILVVTAYLIFWVYKKEDGYHVNNIMAKTESIPNEESRNVISDINLMNPIYVKIANTDFPVVVEDGNYSEELINTALDDINLVYSQLKEYYIGYSTNKKSFQINGNTIQTNVSFNRGNQDLYGPRIFSESNFGYLLEVNGNHQLILSNSLMNEYQKALLFKESNIEEIIKLDSFIQYINQLENIGSLSDVEVKDLFYFITPHLTSIKIEKLRENAEMLVHYKIREPSILEFYYLNPNDDNKILVSETLFLNRESNEVISETNLGYVDSKWQLIY